MGDSFLGRVQIKYTIVTCSRTEEEYNILMRSSHNGPPNYGVIILVTKILKNNILDYKLLKLLQIGEKWLKMT